MIQYRASRHDLLSDVVADDLLVHENHHAPFLFHDPARVLALSRVHDDGVGVRADHRALGQIHSRFAPLLSHAGHARISGKVGWVGTSPCLASRLADCKHPSRDHRMAGALDAMGLRRSPNPCHIRRAQHMGSSRRRHLRPGPVHELAMPVRSVRVRHAACAKCFFYLRQLP